MYRHFFKRLISFVLAFFGLLIFFIPMLLIAIIIKCDSKGPALFKQIRMGKNMQPFICYKFRTMCQGAFEKGGIASSESDNRITKVGAILRRTSLDELPQMFNILNGTMSIIGPRPILDFEFEPYKSNVQYCKRYAVLPGMFCTVDIDLRATADRETQFEMDAEYVDNMSLGLDVRTFFGIISTVILGKNVYKDGK
ncbi:sugar transferase [Bacteroides acidifaciens]|uniref:sugar transferase n=1 Tax=Bacteroides acidifaciens TaxID=85831 RepID=UPI0025969F18|nr:sugar transferase [Bacteroides acidifaciens]